MHNAPVVTRESLGDATEAAMGRRRSVLRLMSGYFHDLGAKMEVEDPDQPVKVNGREAFRIAINAPKNGRRLLQFHILHPAHRPQVRRHWSEPAFKGWTDGWIHQVTHEIHETIQALIRYEALQKNRAEEQRKMADVGMEINRELEILAGEPGYVTQVGTQLRVIPLPRPTPEEAYVLASVIRQLLWARERGEQIVDMKALYEKPS